MNTDTNYLEDSSPLLAEFVNLFDVIPAWRCWA